ncbi:MAG: Mov34/MPN/PAD-1 family protein [Candidatus Heimdallarchaeota archaeon]|nr:MAG: Mov34/MPN/PAD-1 family protein [Candidatus Heimdallarchaeota archaeon]
MQQKEAVLSGIVYNQIMRLLAKNPKIEVVGLCFGIRCHEKIELKSFVSLVNLDNSSTSFSLDYEAMYQEIQCHEERDEILVGIFHSHPKGTKVYPSQKDLYYMRYWPHPYLWLIGGCGEEETDSLLSIFSLLNEKIVEIPYSILNA